MLPVRTPPRRDPAPSRLGYRLNRLWLRPGVRRAVNFGVPMLAGVLAGKKAVPPSPGTLPTTGPLFAALLVGVVLIVGALTFFPVLSLGPIVEHFLMQSGKVF